jgi:alpha-L-rhamnosidase
LKHSLIKMPTIRGEIKGEYKRVNNRLTQYKIELPANMVGEFNAGFSSEDVVTVNGKPVNLSFGTMRLEPGLNEIEIRVNSF